MKAEDLMIGSTYLSVKFNKPITLTSEDIAELVNRADGACIDSYIETMIKPIKLVKNELENISIKWRSTYKVSIDDDKFQPITIDKDNLDSLDVEWKSIHNIVINGWLKLEQVYEDDRWMFYLDGEEIIFEYVHQLQNFFNSVGKQLKYKEDE